MIPRLLGLGLSCAIAALVGSCLAAAFTGLSFVAPIMIAAVAPAAIAFALAPRHFALPVALTASAVGFVVLGAAAVGDADGLAVPTLEGVRSVLSGVVGGWTLATSANVPVPADPEVAPIVVLVTWVTAAFTAEAVLRAARPASVIVPTAIAYPLALVVGGGSGADPGRAALLSACLLALLAVGLAGSRVGPARPLSAVRKFAVGGGAAALLGALVAVLAPALPIARAEQPFDPRDFRTPDVQRRTISNPLAEVKALLTDPPQRQFTARVLSGDPATPAGVRWRTAVLDQYDGRAWSSSATFLPAGPELPLSAPTSQSSPVTEEIEVDGLAGPFLPSPGRPTAVSAAGVGFDDTSGMLIELDGLVARSRYQITADLHQRPSDEALLAAPIGSTSDLETNLRLPELDGDSGDRLDEIRLFATTTAADTPGGPGAQLLELERRLGATGGFGYDAESTRPGHSVGSLALLLRSKSGYTEQYASLFAIAARQLRIPTRVVVGFRTDTRTSDGTYVILSTHAYVWAESFFDGLGWVSFDPTPVTVGDNPLPPPDLQPEDPDGDGDNPGASTEVVRGPSTTLLGAPRSVVVGLLVLIGVAAVAILAMVATIIGMKMLRRRRRRNASSDAVRVVAAWQEAQDRVRDWGVPVLLSHTDRQIVTTSIEALGEERAGRLGSLASLATSAKFAGERPPRSAGNSAWNEADALRLDLRSGRSIIARVRATLNPRSLVGPQR